MTRKLSFEELFSKRPSLQELKNWPRLPVTALVENIRSMHNVGSIFRTSDAVRIEHLYLTGFTAYPPRKEIDKTALGATESVPWSYSRDPLQYVKDMKKRKVHIMAVEHTTVSTNYMDAHYRFPICIIVGNEIEGVSTELIKYADEIIELPMLGLKQSLNVSVAFGIILYHVLLRYKEMKQLNLDSSEHVR